MKRYLCILSAVMLAIAGCGGSGDGQTVSGRGEVSGVVFDEEGEIVRDAVVTYDASSGGERRSTRSNSTGAYILQGVPGNERDGVFISVRAEVTINGVRHTGVNVGQVFSGDRAKNVNITVFPTNRQATLRGAVFYRAGGRIQGARVFARPRNGNVPTSAVTLTNENGDYTLRGLRSGVLYDLQVNALGSNTDTATVTLNAGETRTMDFEVGDTTDPNLPAPQGVVATAWTSPEEVTRDRELNSAIEAIKNMLKPERKQALKTRVADNGFPIEVDVYWNSYRTNSLLGFAIYRRTTGSPTWVELLRDPMAQFFADIDEQLQEARTYTYQVSAISTGYDPNFPNDGESPLSNSYTVETLGGIDLLGTTGSPAQFRWTAAREAEVYQVYIFDRYPTVGSNYLFASPEVTGTTYTYAGPSLPNGTYYYVVVGMANEGDSLSVSRVGTFQR